MFNQGFNFVYGGRRGMWFSLDRFDTAEEAEEACVRHMKEQIMNGYGTEDNAVFRKGWSSEWDDAGLIKQTTSTTLVTIIDREFIELTNWETEIYKRIEDLKDPTSEEIQKIIRWIDNLKTNYRLVEDQVEWLTAYLQEKSQVRKIIKGDFTEGSVVVVNIDGDIISRKVNWSGQAKDLYVIKKNKKYFLCEFMEGNKQ